MVQVAVTDLAAYFDDEITAMPNLITTAATTVGALDSGSITSGFTSIDVGAGAITTTGAVSTGTVTATGVVDITGTTDSSDASGDTGILRVEGGASIAKKLYVGTDLDVDGTANLDVVDIDGAVDMASTLQVDGVATFTAVPVFPNNTIETADIQADAITGAKIADDAINSEHYTDGSIDTAHIGDSQVTAAKLAQNSVDSSELIDGSIDTSHLSADCITEAKIADNALQSEHYQDGSIDTAHLADSQITVAKMAANSVDTDQYVDGSIDTVHIADDQITAAKTDTATNGTVEVNKIVTTDGDGTVTFPDSAKARFGNGADLQIYHDGTNNYIYGNSGELRIQIAGGENAIKIVNEGQVELYRDNVKRFETSELGNTAHGILLASRGIENYATDAATSVSTATVQIKTHGGDSTLTNFGGNSGGGGYIQRTNSNGGAVYPIHLNPYGGNVVIGATASILSSIGRLSSYADASAPFLLSQNSGTGGTNYFARMYANNTNAIGSINCTNTATVFNTSSDYRLKENVNYTWDATTRLKQLKPARFNFIVDDTNTLVDGFLAHEVSSIVPEAITGDKDAMTAEVLYVEGDELPEGKSVGDVKTASVIDPQGIDQSKLVPLLVKTIQELEARITALEDA